MSSVSTVRLLTKGQVVFFFPLFNLNLYSSHKDFAFSQSSKENFSDKDAIDFTAV